MTTETKTETPTPTTINEQPTVKTEVVLTEGEKKAAEAAEKPVKKGPITYKTIIGVIVFVLILGWVAYVYRASTPHTTPAKPAVQVTAPADGGVKTPDLGHPDLVPVKAPVKDAPTDLKQSVQTSPQTPVQSTVPASPVQSVEPTPVAQPKQVQAPVQTPPVKVVKKHVKKAPPQPAPRTEVTQEPAKAETPVQAAPQPEVHQEPQGKDGK